jgi:hypothetical protein
MDIPPCADQYQPIAKREKARENKGLALLRYLTFRKAGKLHNHKLCRRVRVRAA